MCGIFALLNACEQSLVLYQLIASFQTGSKRGPDHSSLYSDIKSKTYTGFHRLAINGLNEHSNQPIQYEDILLICNGEIYNYSSLYKLLNITPTTQSDCEVIIHLYLKYGFEKAIQMLDGVFALCLFDQRKHNMYVARDPFGVRPLLTSVANVMVPEKKTIYGFASTLESLRGLTYIDSDASTTFKQFRPGTFEVFSYKHESDEWVFNNRQEYFNVQSFTSIPRDVTIMEQVPYLKAIRDALECAVEKRVDNCERQIGCLLSGGLDSSLITSLVNKYHKAKTGKAVKTFSIGMRGSMDLHYAKKVSDFLKTDHTEICLDESEFLSQIPDVIKHIESFDTTTVRASVGNYIIAKCISTLSDCKVIFNGDGSDEVCGGYLYFHYAPTHIDFDIECKRLLSDIHFFDVLRSDRTISSNGLESRTPFLDKGFVGTYLSIPSTLRYNTTKSYCEKYLLRKAFDDDVTLPKEVLWRTKEAFSDGVSKNTRSWYEVIQDHIGNIDSSVTDIPNSQHSNHMLPTTEEQKYYRHEFLKHYAGCETTIPYFWMPKFIDAKDASARTLSVYKQRNGDSAQQNKEENSDGIGNDGTQDYLHVL